VKQFGHAPGSLLGIGTSPRRQARPWQWFRSFLPAVALVPVTLAPAQPARSGDAACSDCARVQQALADSQRTKPGVTRRDAEAYFKYDGGLSSRERAWFKYPKCRYIKLQIEFEAAPSTPAAVLSPEDKVTAVSKLYIDYPTMD
jgi:hypothetical protein